MSKPNLFKYASEIRKEGELWPDAVDRAKTILGLDDKTTSKPTPKKTGLIRRSGESTADFFKRKQCL